MRGGQLRNKVAIQEKTETSDGMGGFSTAWADREGLSRISAAIWEVKSNELVEARGKQAEISHKIRIRYFSGITNKMRVLHGSRIFRIISIINPGQRNFQLDLMCLERVD